MCLLEDQCFVRVIALPDSQHKCTPSGEPHKQEEAPLTSYREFRGRRVGGGMAGRWLQERTRSGGARAGCTARPKKQAAARERSGRTHGCRYVDTVSEGDAGRLPQAWETAA